MAQATFDEVLEAVEHLPPDAQADLIEVIRRRLAERGRQRVIEEIRLARLELEMNQARPAMVDDLIREIES